MSPMTELFKVVSDDLELFIAGSRGGGDMREPSDPEPERTPFQDGVRRQLRLRREGRRRHHRHRQFRPRHPPQSRLHRIVSGAVFI